MPVAQCGAQRLQPSGVPRHFWTPHLITSTSRDDWERARLYGRTATGLLRYHHPMADTSPTRMTRLCALRESMMAHNLLAVAARRSSTPGGWPLLSATRHPRPVSPPSSGF